MDDHIRAEGLTKTFRVPVRREGIRSALGSLFRPTYTTVKAVDTVSFRIGRGERVGFIGPNGAGKTTTLKMLSGLLYPTSGDAQAAGFTPWRRQAQYLRRISMLMGNRSQLQWNNTVYDTMLIFREIYSIPKRQFVEQVAELASMLEVEHLLRTRARNLSLGERSKCEFILALLHRPEILYLDEPTLGMDVTMQLRLRRYIQTYNERHAVTVLLTSHYMSDITSVCPRVLMINHGKLLYDGSMSGLVDRLTPFRLVTATLEGEAPLTEARLRADGIPGDLLGSDGNACTLRVGRTEATAAVARLLGCYQVVDLSISEPPIESVIDQLYTGEANL